MSEWMSLQPEPSEAASSSEDEVDELRSRTTTPSLSTAFHPGKRKATKHPPREEPPRKPRLEAARAGPSSRPAVTKTLAANNTRPPLPIPDWKVPNAKANIQSNAAPSSSLTSSGIPSQPVRRKGASAGIPPEVMTRPIPRYKPASGAPTTSTGAVPESEVRGSASAASVKDQRPGTSTARVRLSVSPTAPTVTALPSGTASNHGLSQVLPPQSSQSAIISGSSPTARVKPSPFRSTMKPSSPSSGANNTTSQLRKSSAHSGNDAGRATRRASDATSNMAFIDLTHDEDPIVISSDEEAVNTLVSHAPKSVANTQPREYIVISDDDEPSSQNPNATHPTEQSDQGITGVPGVNNPPSDSAELDRRGDDDEVEAGLSASMKELNTRTSTSGSGSPPMSAETTSSGSAADLRTAEIRASDIPRLSQLSIQRQQKISQNTIKKPEKAQRELLSTDSKELDAMTGMVGSMQVNEIRGPSEAHAKLSTTQSPTISQLATADSRHKSATSKDPSLSVAEIRAMLTRSGKERHEAANQKPKAARLLPSSTNLTKRKANIMVAGSTSSNVLFDDAPSIGSGSNFRPGSHKDNASQISSPDFHTSKKFASMSTRDSPGIRGKANRSRDKYSESDRGPDAMDIDEEWPIQASESLPTHSAASHTEHKPHRHLAVDDQDLRVITHEMSYLMNRPGPHRLIKDIPHFTKKLMSHSPQRALRSRTAKDILEARIRTNTLQDESTAPRIHIINHIDNTNTTPPFEFHYSNEYWYDFNVPPPDYDGVQGCDCIGPCDPRSKTCSCLKLQGIWNEEGVDGFIYDENGCLKQASTPAFECNWKCRCDDDCSNRVVQHGRKIEVNIVKTKAKGWGVFAGSKLIPNGSYIGTYAGELITTDRAEELGHAYDKLKRTYLFDIDFWHLKEMESPKPHRREEDEGWESKYTIDAFHVGNFTRFMNHSCDPNAHINAVYINSGNYDIPLFCIFAYKDIQPWEEICFSYHGFDNDVGTQKEATEGGASHGKCYCGAKNCVGIMFR